MKPLSYLITYLNSNAKVESNLDLAMKFEAEMTPPLADRLNEGKPQVSYILDFPCAIRGLSRVMEQGALKYSKDNWKKFQPSDRLLDSLLRHLLSRKAGEKLDPESQQDHLYHALSNLLMLCEQEGLK